MEFQIPRRSREYSRASYLYRRLHPRGTGQWRADLILLIILLVFPFAPRLHSSARVWWSSVICLSLYLLWFVWSFVQAHLASRRMAAMPPIACSADAAGLRVGAESYVWQEFEYFENPTGVIMLTRAGKNAPVLIPTGPLSAAEFAGLSRLLRAHVPAKGSALGMLAES